MTEAALVNQLEVEARCRTQFDNRWQVKGEHHRIFNLGECAHRATGDRIDFILIPRTVGPVFQRDERDTSVLTTTSKTKAVNRKDGFNVIFLFGEIIVGHLIENFLRTLLGCTRWQLRHAQEDPLVLVRQEGAWQTNEQVSHADNDDQIEQQITTGAAQDVAYAVGVVVRALLEHVVEPAKETFG